MKRTSLWLFFVGLGLALGGGCGEATTSEQLGGETHWLKSCGGSGADQCGPSLECVCGVCTSACADDASCAGVSSEARCAARETTAYASACTESAPERLCVRPESTGGDGGSGTALYGRRYDLRGCFGAQELAGYTPTTPGELGCSDAETYASNGPNTCWLFSNSCLPEGFAPIPRFDTADGCTAVRDTCPDSLSCDAAEVATVAGCLSCDEARRALPAAVSLLAEPFAVCNSDVDCVAHQWQSGCDEVCPEAVNAESVESFDVAVRELSSGYCATSDWAATCGRSIVDCSVVPLCRAGSCVISGDLACAERSLANCEADGDCALASAFPYDTQGECFGPNPLPVACVDPDLSCRPSLTAALDGDGDCYSFGNCLPDGYERAPDDHECSAAIAATCGG